LCLALAALVLIWMHSFVSDGRAVAAVLLIYTAVIALLWFRPLFPSRPRVRLAVVSWLMLAFVTAVLCLSGKAYSPLFNLYLLPLILSALTLGWRMTLIQFVAIAVCHLGLALATPGIEVATLSFASRAVGTLAPILLAAYLTSTLSADVTEARERIENLAQTDVLTGLLNQRAFNAVWQRIHRTNKPYALLMIDINQLKSVNDTFGHEAGNEVLNLVAQCLHRSIRATDSAARFGGDEFAVLLPQASEEIAAAVVKRIRNTVYKTTLDLRSRMIRCTVSIGVALHPRDARDMREMLSSADQDMYRDKQLRRAPDAPASA
jgi:diguanylate cyclase (GGDEF)-like protein